MKRFIIYHDEADGRCAAAIAGRDAVSKRMDPVYLPVQYGDKPPWAILGTGAENDQLWILDIAFPEDLMWEIVIRFPRTTWIDHNECSIEHLNMTLGSLPGIRNPAFSTAFATWHLIHSFSRAPLPVLLISDHHMRTFRLDEMTRQFMAVFNDRADVETSPGCHQWDFWLECHSAVSLCGDLEFGRILLSREARNRERALSNAAKQAYSQAGAVKPGSCLEVVS